MARSRRNWTPQEDALLRTAVNNALSQSRPLLWRELAKSVPDRSNKDCRRRWWNTLADGPAKGSWSEAEDERLIEAVQKHGPNWSQVARAVGSRNSDQCLSHWNHVLDPDINHSDWNAKEDEALLHAVLTHGTNWTAVAVSHTPKRTTLALKNRYGALRLRHENSKKPKETTAGSRLPDIENSAMTTSSIEEGMNHNAQETGQTNPRQRMDVGDDENDYEERVDDEDDGGQDDDNDDCDPSYIASRDDWNKASFGASNIQIRERLMLSPPATAVNFSPSNEYGLSTPPMINSPHHDVSQFGTENWMNGTMYATLNDNAYSLGEPLNSLGSVYDDHNAINDAGFTPPFEPRLSASSQNDHESRPKEYEVSIEALCSGTELQDLMVGLTKIGTRLTLKMKPKDNYNNSLV